MYTYVCIVDNVLYIYIYVIENDWKTFFLRIIYTYLKEFSALNKGGGGGEDEGKQREKKGVEVGVVAFPNSNFQLTPLSFSCKMFDLGAKKRFLSLSRTIHTNNWLEKERISIIFFLPESITQITYSSFFSNASV